MKVSIDVEVPKTCGECPFYRKYTDRGIDHVNCTMGSYNDANTPYNANYDNDVHHHCVLYGKAIIELAKEVSLKKKKEKLLKVLQEYEMREFDETKHHTIKDIENILNLAYTTTSSEEHEVQVDFNIKELQWEEYIDGELKIVHKRNSLEEFIEELSMCSFDDIVSDILFMAEEMEEKENGNYCD